MNIEFPNLSVHKESNNFREQIAVLYPIVRDNDCITLIRSFIQVCQSGLASFDQECPGNDSLESWNFIDSLIEKESVVGVFHTHPSCAECFSFQDISVQNGFAKSYGERKIWHGIQPAGQSNSLFVCTWMVYDRIFRYDYGWMPDNLNNPIITLPLPCNVFWNDRDGVYEV